MVVSATITLIVSAAPAVTYTAAKNTTPWNNSETTVCTTDYFT
jgi:hypothetical protein